MVRDLLSSHPKLLALLVPNTKKNQLLFNELALKEDTLYLWSVKQITQEDADPSFAFFSLNFWFQEENPPLNAEHFALVSRDLISKQEREKRWDHSDQKSQPDLRVQEMAKPRVTRRLTKKTQFGHTFLPPVPAPKKSDQTTTHLLGRTGLKNFGLTCYMNVVLQCVVHIPQLVHFFLDNGKRRLALRTRVKVNSTYASIPPYNRSLHFIFANSYKSYGKAQTLSPQLNSETGFEQSDGQVSVNRAT